MQDDFYALGARLIFKQNNVIIGATFPTVEQAETAIDWAKDQFGREFVQGHTPKSQRVIYYQPHITNMFVRGITMSKKWYKSKTIIGLGGPLATLGLAILGLPEFRALIDNLPVASVGYASLAAAIAAVTLRWVTKGPVEW